jgi:MoxR-like ATPase
MMHLMAEPGEAVNIQLRDGVPEQIHVFDEASVLAVNAALAARRPLLVRGEPGCGKTQLARAAAVKMGRVFVSHVVDSHTEPRDLLWTFDAVARLAEAQVQGALRAGATPAEADALRQRLEVANYVVPGALWWAFAWDDATKQAKRAGRSAPVQPEGAKPEVGAVVLIDEIDKAESDVPNGLLEALGEGQFTPEGRSEPVKAQGLPPLIVITTNEERGLPDAFLRRCLVLQLALPQRRDELMRFLVARGRAHFPQADESLLESAAGMLAEDREAARKQDQPPPGQAEYLDLVRAVLELARGDLERQRQTLERIRAFSLRKHPETSAE